MQYELRIFHRPAIDEECWHDAVGHRMMMRAASPASLPAAADLKGVVVWSRARLHLQFAAPGSTSAHHAAKSACPHPERGVASGGSTSFRKH
jgi:hypothetical protein